MLLNEKLHVLGILGCILCIVGSTSIVLHAPEERTVQSVKEVWQLALEPGERAGATRKRGCRRRRSQSDRVLVILVWLLAD
jgi:hypothetical protein